MIRRLFHGVGANLFDRLAMSIMQIVAVPVLVSIWGSSQYGLWLMLTTVPTYLALSDLGFAQSAGVQMAMYVARGEYDRAISIQHSARMALSLVGAALVSITWICIIIGFIPENLFGSTGSSIPVVVGILATYGIVILQGGLAVVTLRSDGHYALSSYLTTAINIVEQLAVIMNVLLGGNILTASICLLVCRVLGVLLINIVMRKKLAWAVFGFAKYNSQDLRSLYGPAKATTAITLANASFLQGITLAVGMAAGAASVPVFTTVRTLIRLGIQMTNVLSSAMSPEFSALFAKNDRSSQALLISGTVLYSLVLLIPLSVLVMLFGPYIINVWSNGNILATWDVVAVMAIVMILNGIWMPLSIIIISTNKHSSFAYKFLILSMLSLALAYILALRLGPLGGAIANLVLDLAMLATIVRLTHKTLISLYDLTQGGKVLINNVKNHALALYKR